MISTRHLTYIPEISVVKRISQAIALLDAILQPTWDLRYYSFNSKWGEQEMMASMRDGHGSSYHIEFSPVGAIIKGTYLGCAMDRFAYKNGKPWPGVLEDVPAEFSGFLRVPAFAIEEASFCIWRRNTAPSWKI